MKRIYLLIDSLGSGGAQRQIVELAVLLKERRNEVLVGYYPLYTSINRFLTGMAYHTSSFLMP